MARGFVPLQYGELSLLGSEYFGGGEEGDGRDLYGYPRQRRSSPDERVVDLWGRSIPTPEDAILAAEEAGESDADADTDVYTDVSVNGEPLEIALKGLEGEDAPATFVFAHLGWSEPYDAGAHYTAQAIRASDAFERDGITKIGSRRNAYRGHGWGAFVFREFNRQGNVNAWKRHRRTQYRPRRMEGSSPAFIL